MLKAEDLNVYYGPIHAVKGVSFEVREGEIVTLIGANGAGKSTTLKTLSGLMRSRGGKIEFMGKSIANTPAHKLYERLGFEYRGTQHLYAENTGWMDFLFFEFRQ